MLLGVGLVLHWQNVLYHDVLIKLIPGNFKAERSPSEVPFGAEALTSLLSASDYVINFKHPKLTNAHILKALLTSEEPVNSALEILHILKVDLAVVHRRIDTIIQLIDQKTQLFAMNIADSVKVKSSTPKVVSDYFSEETSSIISFAQQNARELNDNSIGINHILHAIGRNESSLRNHLEDIIACDGVLERMTRLNPLKGGASMDGRFFTEDSKDALLAARTLAVTLNTTISPAILLFGVLSQSSSASLFTDADLENLGEIKRRLHADIVESHSKELDIAKPTSLMHPLPSEPVRPSVNSQPLISTAGGPVALLVSQKVLRILGFAKEEAILARQRKIVPPHLVLAMIKESFLSEVEFVQHRGRVLDTIIATICREQSIERSSSSLPDPTFRTDLANFASSIPRLLLCAQIIASDLGARWIDLNHLALAVIQQEARLTQIIIENSATSKFALKKRLEQCSLRQEHLHEAEESPPVWLKIFALDYEISETKDVTRSSSNKVSLEVCLSQRSRRVLGFAVEESNKFGYSQISIEIILLGLMYETFGITVEVFSLLGVDFQEFRAVLVDCYIKSSERAAAFRPLTANGQRILSKSSKIAQQWNKNEIEPEHILLAIADEHRGVAAFACEALQIDGNLLRSEIIAAMQKAKAKPR